MEKGSVRKKCKKWYYGGLIFNYDLLGYGMMALSILFMGFTIKGKNPRDKWLKYFIISYNRYVNNRGQVQRKNSLPF